MFEIKYELNKIHCTIFVHQVGWLDGKGIDIYPWGLRFKPHKGHNCGQQWYVDYIIRRKICIFNWSLGLKFSCK